MDNGEYKLLTSLERRDALLYIESQIDAQCGQAKRLIEAFTKHPGHRDVIESFIDYNIKQLVTLSKIRNIFYYKQPIKNKDMKYYSETEYNANKGEIADAFVILHLCDRMSAEEKELFSHLLSVLNDFIDTTREGTKIEYCADD